MILFRVFGLSTSIADTEQLEAVLSPFEERSSYYKDLQLDGYLQLDGPVLKTADVSWQCDGNQHRGKAQVRFYDHPISGVGWDVILTKFGFEKISYEDYCCCEPRISDTTYGAIIDPSIGPSEQKYPISRKIPSGDVERFHIMVGSPMSCHLQVRFKFFVDQTTIIESNIFDIDIWNPRNSQWHLRYTDNKSQAEKSFSYRMSEKLIEQRDASIFPLTSTQYPTISQTSPLDTEEPKSPGWESLMFSLSPSGIRIDSQVPEPKEVSTEDRDGPSPSEQVSTPALVDHSSQEIYPPVEPRHLELIRNMKRFFKARFKRT